MARRIINNYKESIRICSPFKCDENPETDETVVYIIPVDGKVYENKGIIK